VTQDAIREARAATLRLAPAAAEKLAAQGKLHPRERIDLLMDPGSFVEDGQFANALATGLPADGVVTGRGTVEGRPGLVVPNHPTLEAGSWGARPQGRRADRNARSADLRRTPRR